MRFLVYFCLVFLISAPNVSASTINNEVNIKSSGGSSSVKIDNNVNTGSNTQTSQTSKTSVEIHQTGEGTSNVNINGKQWQLKGPGDISVSESTPATNSPAVTPNPGPSLNPLTFSENLIKKRVEQIINIFQQIFKNLWKGF